MPSLLLPSGSLSLTAEKYLLALNCTRFVSLLRSVNLSHYIQIPADDQDPTIVPAALPFARQRPLVASSGASSAEAYTILAPRDAEFDTHWFGTDGLAVAGSSLPSPGSQALKELLEYHIVKGKWTQNELEDGTLVPTVLKGDNLKGANQRLPVSVSTAEMPDDGDDGGLFGGGWWRMGKGRSDEKKKKPGVVAFGGASVIADPGARCA